MNYDYINNRLLLKDAEAHEILLAFQKIQREFPETLKDQLINSITTKYIHELFRNPFIRNHSSNIPTKIKN